MMMKNETTTTTAGQPPRGWRFRIGIIIFVVGFLSPLLIPVVAATDLPTTWKAAISGLLAAGIPEIFSIVAIAVMGKSGFNYIKARIFAFLKKYAPPDRVTRTRYRIGLVMFLLPVFFGWLVPYGPHLIPGYEAQRFIVNLAGDLMLVASLFVLGGDFWDKVRALFIYNSRVQFQDHGTQT
jgi:hypothetical protein